MMFFFEEIYNETNYEDDYLTCALKTCPYSFNHRFDYIYALLILFGLIEYVQVILFKFDGTKVYDFQAFH